MHRTPGNVRRWRWQLTYLNGSGQPARRTALTRYVTLRAAAAAGRREARFVVGPAGDVHVTVSR